MSIYLSLFKTIVGKKITDSRLLPIILAGANRAFPYAKNIEKLLEDVKDVYFLAHNSNYRTAIPALKLLFQFHKMNDYVSDRYYNALYRKLLDPCPPAAYSQLLKLLFDTMKDDPSAQRVRAYVKRLLQVAVNVNSEFAASILILISKLKMERKQENLVVLSSDADPTLKVVTNLDDDEEERYVDLDTDGNVIVKGEVKSEDDVIETTANSEDSKKVAKGTLGASSTGGWIHHKNARHGAKTPYDPLARNPLFIDAQHVADNELLLLSNHFHPSVAVFAKCLLEGGEVKYGGDALNDFTLMAFLDRFAFRNPKEISAKSTGRVVRKKKHDPWGVRKLAVDSKEYTQKKRDEIPADEKFLHRYASTVIRDKNVKKEEDGKDGENDDWEYAESVNSEEFDTIMERFEPGELNEEFDIDYSKEFSSEKNKRNKPTIADEDDVDMDEDDELDLEDDEEEGEGGEDLEDDEPEDGSDDDEPEDDDEDDEGDFGGSSNVFGDDDSSDEEIGANDYELAGDRFAEMLEDLEEEEHEGKGKKGKKIGWK
ncbi:unnamed protein product [Caenorhabditis angaria]|uniref:CCAAT-binding factor domain-containing protein n=1 Tax=Caenorhabditis angaria TaxID=860376 RepID=A0A9P1ISD4_9PELO|nr:unnamed protein product [Caenorhabditis angaria]